MALRTGCSKTEAPLLVRRAGCPLRDFAGLDLDFDMKRFLLLDRILILTTFLATHTRRGERAALLAWCYSSKSERTSSTLMAEANAASSSSTAVKSLAFFSFKAMTFSSMVFFETIR